MARPRSLPDSNVYSVVLTLIAAEGEKGVTFSAVSRGTGLAGASLVQRYGSVEGMVRAALEWAWSQMDLALSEAESSEDRALPAMLRTVAERANGMPICALMAASQRDPALRARAEAWRQRVDAAIGQRSDLGKADASPMVFAAWMGQWMWEPLGGKGFKLKDATKRLVI